MQYHDIFDHVITVLNCIQFFFKLHISNSTHTSHDPMGSLHHVSFVGLQDQFELIKACLINIARHKEASFTEDIY